MVNVLTVGRSTADPNLADWYVDGFPLARLKSRFECGGPTPGGNGVLATRHPDDLRALLGRPVPSPQDGSPSSGRMPLHSCSHCGDPDCGVLAVRVTCDHETATVTWTDFAWESPRTLRPDRVWRRLSAA